MGANAMQLLEECIERLREGRLDRNTSARFGFSHSDRQCQTAAFAVSADRNHRSHLRSDWDADGQGWSGLDGPFDYADWPYKTVLDAINEGWRVIRFPVQLPVGHTQDTHITCEFILEKWE